LHKCKKSFCLEPSENFVLTYEELGDIRHFTNQEELMRFLSTILTQSNNIVKFKLTPMTSELIGELSTIETG
jgi:hypothetical protein